MGVIDRKFYDAIVHPTAGVGDYTSIATALSTEGANKSIYVAPGSYSESEDVEPDDNQQIYFDRVTINFANAKGIRIVGKDYIKMSGQLTLNGDTDMFHVKTDSNFVNAEDLQLIIDTSAGYAYVYAFYIDATSDYNVFGNIHIKAIDASVQHQLAGVVAHGTGNKINATIETINNSYGGATACWGIFSSGGTRNVFNVSIDTISTTTGNTGVGVYLLGATRSVVLGGVAAPDSGNEITVSGGSSNKYGEVTI